MLFSGLQAIFLAALLLLVLGVRAHLLAENLFLRHQIQLLLARVRKARRPEARTRLIMAITSRLFDWRPSLLVVQPETLISWQRQAFRKYWRARSRRKRRHPQRWGSRATRNWQAIGTVRFSPERPLQDAA